MKNQIDLDETYHLMTLEALADVDAGNVIDHDAVVAWADSLSAEQPKNLAQPN